MIDFTCPHCGEAMSVPASLMGQEESCPRCGRAAVIPVMRLESTEEARHRIARVLAARAQKAAAAVPPVKPRPRRNIRQIAGSAQLQWFLANGYSERDLFTWVASNGTDACQDCRERHGATKPLWWWRQRGLPKAGGTACGRKCFCQIVPEGYAASNQFKSPGPEFVLCQAEDACGALEWHENAVCVTPHNIIATAIERWNNITANDLSTLEYLLLGQYPDMCERHLLYALRVSKTAETCKSPKTLASRWATASTGGGTTGLACGAASPSHALVSEFLSILYVNRFTEMMQAVLDKAATTAQKRKTAQTRVNCWTQARDRIAAVSEAFTPAPADLNVCVQQLLARCDAQAGTP